MSRPVLKAVEAPLDGPREELRLAILDIEQAESAAAKATAAVELASDQMRLARLAYSKAEDAFSEVTSRPRSLQDKLREAFDVDDQMRIAEEHYNAPPRAPVTASDLAKLRAAVQSASDEVVAAQSTLDLAQNRAGPAASALRRAQGRRREAVYEVTRPEIGRLVREAQDLVELLIAKRAELNFVSSTLVEPMGNDRRQAYYFLNRQSFPEEQGLKTDNDLSRRDAAIGQWQLFTEVITKDANTPFPS
jgi:hypothetical protein